MIKPVESIPVTVTIEHGDQVHRFTAKSATLDTVFGHMYINMEYPVVSKNARAIDRDTAQAVDAEREAIAVLVDVAAKHAMNTSYGVSDEGVRRARWLESIHLSELALDIRNGEHGR